MKKLFSILLAVTMILPFLSLNKVEAKANSSWSANEYKLFAYYGIDLDYLDQLYCPNCRRKGSIEFTLYIGRDCMHSIYGKYDHIIGVCENCKKEYTVAYNYELLEVPLFTETGVYDFCGGHEQFYEYHIYTDCLHCIDYMGNSYKTINCPICGHWEFLETLDLPVEHHYGIVEGHEPTCTDGGYKVYECTSCYYDSYSEKFGVPTGHNYVVDQVVSPTCQNEGYTINRCHNSYIGYYYGDSYPCECDDFYYNNFTDVLPHKYVAQKTVEPTCTEKGYTVYKCVNGCEDTYKSDYVDAAGHIWNPWTIEKVATSTSTGLRRRNCSVCGVVESEIIPISVHTHNYILTQNIDATCLESGSKTFTCTICQDTYTEKIAKKSHSYVRHDVAPTCTDDGYTYYTCNNCDIYASTSVRVPATGHSFGGWTVTKAATTISTGIEEHICPKCGKKETRVIPKLTVDNTPVVLDNHNISLDYKETSKLIATSINDVEWSSSNSKIIEVDNGGNIKAVGTGTAEIVVKDVINNTTDKCKITVSYTWWQWIIRIVLFGWIWY